MPVLVSPTGGLGHAAACIVALSQRSKESFRCTHSGSDLHGHLLVALPPPRRGSTMHSGAAIALRDVPAAASHGTACWACQGSGCFGR